MASSKKLITKDEVLHIAGLGNLTLTPTEVELYTKQLQDVLAYIEQLAEVDTTKVAPTFQTLDNTTNVFREDKIKEGLTQKEALANAKETHAGYFVTENVFSGKKPSHEDALSPRKKLDKYNAVLTQVADVGNLGHKDLFSTKGVETTAGSNVLSGYVPQYSATVVDQLEAAGYTTKYKLNEDAWGHGSSGENSDFGPTLNPWNEDLVAGGSSSGSGAALAAGMIDLATGTDTCGSIRMPSSYCNVCGIKPTYGAVSRYGVIAFASSLDCPGLMARNVGDLKSAYKKLFAVDTKDATSQSTGRKTAERKVKIIGMPKEFFDAALDSEVKGLVLSAVEQLKSEGYKIKTVSLPHAKYGIAAYYIIAPTETASNLARYDGVRFGNSRAGFGAEAKRRIMLGAFSSSAGYADKYYEKAARVRTLIITDLEKALSEVDALIGPVSSTPPYKVGEKVDDPLKLYLMDIYAAPASLAGLPSLALPCGFTASNLPVGMQLIGPRWSEGALFDVGEKYQKLTDWHTRNPEGVKNGK